MSNIGGNARNQILAQEIINMKAQFGMTYNLYCYKKLKVTTKMTVILLEVRKMRKIRKIEKMRILS